MNTQELAENLVERFFRYTAIESQSNAAVAALPSSAGQLQLAELLRQELLALGLTDVVLTPDAILTAKLPANMAAQVPAIGFLAHLDTVDVSLSPQVKAQMVKGYDGTDICLNSAQDIWLRTAEHPEILAYRGQDIIVSDGTSVLGADNKAAIAAIMTALAHLQQDDALLHGDIHVAFVPDEEIGLRGSKAMDLARFPVAFAYTIDSCELGEVVYETFNAGSMNISIQGVTAHPMSAKGVLVNPILVANDIISHLNRTDTPECTEGKEGYFWVTKVQGQAKAATLTINIRDFDKRSYEARKAYLADLMRFMAARHPKAKIEYTITDVYGNIADALTPESQPAIDYIYEAMRQLNITPKTLAMRGGTDGSALSVRGIPTPNFFTGAHNFHSNCEFLPVPSFEKSCRMILTMIHLVNEAG